MSATSTAGTSPTLQAMPPPTPWSARSAAVSVYPSAVHQSAARTVELDMIARPKKAWNARVASSRMSRNGNAGRFGPGSTPISTQKNRYPVARKCTVMRT